VAGLFESEVAGFEGDRDFFFHCAGTIQPIGFAGEVAVQEYTRNVLLNSASPQVLGEAFLRATRRTQADCYLIMISSGAAHSVYAGWTSYGAGKAAVDQWVRAAGAEQALRGRRCRVLSVARSRSA
jgi:benzil reductase ((S)-benzoin forming)